jgi:hypothetical protein
MPPVIYSLLMAFCLVLGIDNVYDFLTKEVKDYNYSGWVYLFSKAANFVSSIIGLGLFLFLWQHRGY